MTRLSYGAYAPARPGLTRPTLLVTAATIGVAQVYWTRPYPNPATTGEADAYLWLGSTDHSSGAEENMYRGYSAAPNIAPSSWTVFRPASAGNQRETPCFVHNPASPRPFWLYLHPSMSESGGNQGSRLVTHTGADWENGTDEGEVLPATANIAPDILDHTGYMWVERRSATNWHAWSFVRAASAHGRAEYGHWTSTDGLDWTCVNDDLDVRSMCPSGRQLVLRAFQPFTVDGTDYIITTEHPDTTATGGADADPAGRVVLMEATSDEAWTGRRVVFGPPDLGTTDDLRDVRAYQDDADPNLIHLYIHVARSHVYYAALTAAA